MDEIRAGVYPDGYRGGNEEGRLVLKLTIAKTSSNPFLK